MPVPPRRRSLLDTRWPIVAVCAVLLLLLALLVRALWDRGPAPDRQGEGRPAPLSIVGGQFDALPDLVPTLLGDTLLVRVAYEGDCEDHRFGLRSRTRGDTLVLRLTHDAADDTCTGRVFDELHLPVPEGAPGARVVVLEDPEGGAPFAVTRAPADAATRP